MPSLVLTSVETQLNFYSYPILMILGSIGNIFIVLLLSRQRANACSIYLISAAIINTLYLIYNGFFEIYPVDYNSGTTGILILCKISAYVSTVLGETPKTLITLACIDRYMITSTQVSYRAFSTPKRAKWSVLATIVFWLLITIHYPIMFTIVYGQCGASGIYLTIFTIYVIVTVGLTPLILMSVFGCLTSRNMKRMRVRIRPTEHSTTNTDTNIQRRDRDLSILVVVEILFNVITTILFPLILIEVLITTYTIPNKTIQHFQIEGFIINFAFLLLYINSAITFYIYFIASKSFRRSFKQVMTTVYQKLIT